MSSKSVFCSISSGHISTLVGSASNRVIFAAPGMQQEVANALAAKVGQNPDLDVTISLDVDEHTLRMGYGDIEAVGILCGAGIQPTHSPGFRSAVLIVDDRGWVFTPTALYLEKEPQSDETPNAVRLSPDQVETLALRLSPRARKEAIDRATTPEEADTIANVQTELGIISLSDEQLGAVKTAIENAPPVKFDVVRQVRVFEPYLQYVELSLSGAAVQRHRVRIPKSLQNLGSSKDLEGRLSTTFDLVDKGGELSSKALEAELNDIRKNFTPSLGKDHGRIVLKAAKPHLLKRIADIRKKLEAHQKKVESELQAKLDESKEQVVDYYLPLAKANPPDALLGSLLAPSADEAAIRSWIEQELSRVFPTAADLTGKMMLEDRYKDVTFETLNREDFLESVKSAFPRIDWDKAYAEFKAAAEEDHEEV